MFQVGGMIMARSVAEFAAMVANAPRAFNGEMSRHTLVTAASNHSKNWLPRMDSHHQPPDSKSGAPLVELQGYKMEPTTGAAPV